MSRARKTLLALAALVLFCSLGAATAQADVFCLNSPTCGAGVNNYPMTRTGLADALLAAQNTAEDSTIEIGSGTIDINTPVAVAASATNKLSIDGVGTNGRPLLKFSFTSGGPGLTFTGSGASPGGISYVDVQLDPVNASRSALDVQDGRVFDVNFDIAAQNFSGSVGMTLSQGAECAFCDFTLSGSSSYGVGSNGTGTVKRSTFTNVGVDSVSTGVTAQAGASINVLTSRFVGLATAVRVAGGTVNLTDSVIDLSARDNARGVDVDNGNPSGSGSRAANLDGVTVVGSGSSQFGLRVAADTTNPTPENATGIAKNSLFLLTGDSPYDLYCLQGANASSQLNATYSLIGFSSPVLSGACGEFDSNNIASDSLLPSELFVNPATGNYRLKKGAAVIDAGVAANDVSLVGRVVDAYSLHRVIGSNVDMGGSEYENLAPTKPTLTPAATTTTVGAAVQLTADSTDPNGDALTYDWNFGDGTVGAGSATSHTFAQPGTYTVSVAASDFDLQGTAADVSITVTAPAPPPNTGGGAETPLSFSFTKPSCKFKLNKKSKNGFTAHAAKVKDCYLQAFSSRAHSYMFRLERTAAGYVVGGQCKAKQGKTGKASKRCNLPLKGSQLVEIPAETSYLTFGGKWNKKALPSGKYTLVAVNPSTPTNKITVTLTYTAKQGKSGKTK